MVSNLTDTARPSPFIDYILEESSLVDLTNYISSDSEISDPPSCIMMQPLIDVRRLILGDLVESVLLSFRTPSLYQYPLFPVEN